MRVLTLGLFLSPSSSNFSPLTSILCSSPVSPNYKIHLPAHPVEATPSSALLRQSFPGSSNRFGCTRSKPSQPCVPADLTVAMELAFVLIANRVLPGWCVDPLNAPCLSGVLNPTTTTYSLVSVLGLRVLSEVFGEFSNAISTNSRISFSLKSRGHSLVGPLPTETASHVGKLFF